MKKPFDAYVAQQQRKAEVLEAQIRADERERMTRDISWLSKQDAYKVGVLSERDRIITLLTETYGEDYVDMGVVGQIVKIIKEEK